VDGLVVFFSWKALHKKLLEAQAYGDARKSLEVSIVIACPVAEAVTLPIIGESWNQKQGV
jgi:hypothetical protein